MIEISTTWGNGLVVMTSLLVAGVFAVRAAVGSRDRGVFLAHALMGVGMAGMSWPSGDPVPASTGAAVFGVIAACFGASWLRSGSRRIDCAAHVAVASAAMALMYLTHSAHVAQAVRSGGGSPGHGAHVALPGGPGALIAAAGLLLTGYFLWHAWESVPRERAPALAGAAAVADGVRCHGAGGPQLATWVDPTAHVTMSLLMAVMSLATV